jgi:flagellar basal body-associated protein FliL
MGTSFCPKCGTAVTPGTPFCPKCGTALGATTPSASSKKSHKGLWIGIVIGVVVVILILAALVYVGMTVNSVKVTAINLQFTGDSCSGWTDGTDPGLTANAGSQVSDTISLPNDSIFSSCTAESVLTSTSGFSIVSSNAPLTVNAGTTQSLSVVIGMPSGSYNGVLTIVISVTTSL